MSGSPRPNRFALTLTVLAGMVWLALIAAWLAHAIPPEVDLEEWGIPDRILFTQPTYALIFGLAAAVSALWLYISRSWPFRPRLFVASLALLPLWQFGVFAADALDFPSVRVFLADGGLALSFVAGLVWVIWFVERRWQEYVRQLALVETTEATWLWNPLHPEAWYYKRGWFSPITRSALWRSIFHNQEMQSRSLANRKLSQSLTVLITYSVLFFALFLLAGQLGGCKEIYEMPAGGGKEQSIAQTVKIQKVVKKKFVINPFSAIVFKPPPIDEVKLQLIEITAHKYAIGQGEGDGAGFSGGTSRGKVRFIRLEYSGGDWNQDFGVGADQNLLIQYGVRTSQQVADQTESRAVMQLAGFPVGKSPPLVYLTGQKNITLSKNEAKTLREYLLEKQGMLFGDNGGSSHFHNQFFAMMRQVVPEIEPVRIPLDDVIHRVPYHLPFLPYVSPHGGREAWGWKKDGRWICYYHPGDIGDAWSDGHSGVKAEVWEACYQLGTNVIFYAHAEYNKWLMARKQQKK